MDEIVHDNSLVVEKWFDAYSKLLDFGFREIKDVSKRRSRFLLRYTNYSKGERKEFLTPLPRKLKINKEFEYFFGLWCGDKEGVGELEWLIKVRK